MCHNKIFYCLIIIVNIKLTFSTNSNFKFIEKLFLNDIHNNDRHYGMGLKHKQTTEDLIKEAGYVAERHELRTEDGYWLVVHRIPRSEGQPVKPNKTAVILQHGLLGSSASWVLNGRNNSLAFILVDEGYDVWMPNIRGNTYSRRHEFLDPKADAPRFWNYSFHEMGTIDMPDIIDYILHSTGQSKVMYVGHSMGTTMAYIMLSMRPEYNQKLKVLVTMAPVAYLGHITSPTIKFLTFIDPLLLYLFNRFKVYEVLPHNKWIEFLDQHLCQNSTLSYKICVTVMESLSGFDTAQLDTLILHKILKHFPAGTSVKVLQHYAQLINGGRFCQYDYGWKGNYYQYNGSFTPPEYDLKNVTAPNFMFHGENDWLSNREDVDRLFDELPHIVGKIVIRYKKFNHFDFLFAKDIKELVYNSLVNVLSRF